MTESKQPQAEVGITTCSAGIWYPLCGQLSGDCALIMVSCRGQSYDQTMREWKALLISKGIILGSGDPFGDPEDDPWDDLLMAKDYEKFTEVMEQAGWKKEFIAFGP